MDFDNQLLENFAGAEEFEREPTEEELAEIEAEMAQDVMLERQELEDFENHYGPCDYDDGGEW